MTIDELKEKLQALPCNYKEAHDWETIHIKVDLLLLRYINDAEVTKLHNARAKWYA